jgi:hypothetical protein
MVNYDVLVGWAFIALLTIIIDYLFRRHEK